MTANINGYNVNTTYRIDWAQRSNEYKAPKGLAALLAAGSTYGLSIVGIVAGNLFFEKAARAFTIAINTKGIIATLGVAKVLAVAGVALLITAVFYVAIKALIHSYSMNQAKKIEQNIREGNIDLQDLKYYFNSKEENLPLRKTDLDELLFKNEVANLSTPVFFERYGSSLALLTEERLKALADKKQIEAEKEETSTNIAADKN